MSHRRAPSGRFFSRAGHTPYHGPDRRQVGHRVPVTQERRRGRREPPPEAQPTTPTPTPAAMLRHERLAAHELALLAPPTFTRDQIAHRAHQVWVESGCLPGRDLENWLAAETLLRQEAGEARQRLFETYRLSIEQDFVANPERFDERLWLSRIVLHEPSV
ncbi:MAG: DUF2934 domain-containing protein [Planctomycetota bacterium]